MWKTEFISPSNGFQPNTNGTCQRRKAINQPAMAYGMRFMPMTLPFAGSAHLPPG
jgi:hypothetical protein